MDKIELTRENFLSLYTNYLSLSAQVDALRSCLFGLAGCLEKNNEDISKGVKTEFYDCWGETLNHVSSLRTVPKWAQQQYDKEINLHLKMIHDLLLEVEFGANS